MCQHTLAVYFGAAIEGENLLKLHAVVDNFCQQLRSEQSCKIRALTHVLLVAAGATALGLDRRLALRAAAVAVVCPEPARAVLACVDGQGPWCGGLEPATNDRAQSAEAVKAAYEAELAQLVNRTATAQP